VEYGAQHGGEGTHVCIAEERGETTCHLTNVVLCIMRQVDFCIFDCLPLFYDNVTQERVHSCPLPQAFQHLSIKQVKPKEKTVSDIVSSIRGL